MTRAVQDAIASICDYERRVLLGDITEWGAAYGQAMEVLKSRGLWRTRFGAAVIAELGKR